MSDNIFPNEIGQYPGDNLNFPYLIDIPVVPTCVWGIPIEPQDSVPPNLEPEAHPLEQIGSSFDNTTRDFENWVTELPPVPPLAIEPSPTQNMAPIPESAFNLLQEIFTTPQPHDEGTSHRSRRTARISVRPPTETMTFRMPTEAEIEQAGRDPEEEGEEVPAVQPMIGFRTFWAGREYATNNVDIWPVDSAYHRIITGIQEPPPLYDFPAGQTATVYDYLDRSVREASILRQQLAASEGKLEKFHAALKRCHQG